MIPGANWDQSLFHSSIGANCIWFSWLFMVFAVGLKGLSATAMDRVSPVRLKGQSPNGREDGIFFHCLWSRNLDLLDHSRSVIGLFFSHSRNNKNISLDRQVKLAHVHRSILSVVWSNKWTPCPVFNTALVSLLLQLSLTLTSVYIVIQGQEVWYFTLVRIRLMCLSRASHLEA